MLSADADASPSFLHGGRVYAHLHPLKTGLYGKTYSVHDYLTPITDAMTRMQVRHSSHALDFFGLLPSLTTTAKQPCAPPASVEPPRRTEPVVGWRCPNAECSNRTRTQLQMETEGATCMLCGAVVAGTTVATHRERLGAAEEDDGTTHADAPYGSRLDAYDKPPLSATEYRASKRAALHVSKLPPKRLKGLRSVHDAAREIARTVERESAAHEALSSRQIVKLRSILEELEKHFDALHPIPLSIQREIRYTATAVWTAACKHSDACACGASCQFKLTSNAHRALAVAIFQSVVERIRDNVDAYNQIDEAMVANVSESMRRSPVFASHQSHVHMHTIVAKIRMYERADFNVPPCAPPQAGRGDDPSTSTIVRCDSIASTDTASSPTSLITQSQRALHTVFAWHKNTMPISVLEASVALLEDDAAFANVQSIVARVPTAPTAPIAGERGQGVFAFCLLNAIMRAHVKASGGVAPLSAPLNVALVHRLEMDLEKVDAAIVEIQRVALGGCVKLATSRLTDEDRFM